MGLKFESYSLPAERPEQVTEWFNDAKQMGQHNLKGNVQLLDVTFDTEVDAIEWLSDNVDKWYGAKAVKANTEDGQIWVVGGYAD